ncbi:MAG: cupin domain-containing protein [Candidatus Korarchaeota archaeon]|nr:cupin domain-containing protein [Candidatus Korarchaeota archaeon]
MYRMLRWSEAKPYETWPGVTRRALTLGERILLLEISFKKDAVAPVHSHPNEQSGYIVKGKLRIRIGDAVHELGPGDAYIIPPNVEHEATALEDTVVVEVFSPPHELLKKDLEQA